MNIDAARDLLNDDDLRSSSKDKNDVLRGLILLAEVNGGIDAEELQMSPGHDCLYAGDFTKTVERMTEEQVRQMAAWGWSEDCDSWFTFV